MVRSIAGVAAPAGGSSWTSPSFTFMAMFWFRTLLGGDVSACPHYRRRTHSSSPRIGCAKYCRRRRLPSIGARSFPFMRGNESGTSGSLIRSSRRSKCCASTVRAIESSARGTAIPSCNASRSSRFRFNSRTCGPREFLSECFKLDEVTSRVLMGGRATRRQAIVCEHATPSRGQPPCASVHRSRQAPRASAAAVYRTSSAQRATLREVDPARLRLVDEQLYLIAWARAQSGWRTYKIMRIDLCRPRARGREPQMATKLIGTIMSSPRTASRGRRGTSHRPRRFIRQQEATKKKQWTVRRSPRGSCRSLLHSSARPYAGAVGPSRRCRCSRRRTGGSPT